MCQTLATSATPLAPGQGPCQILRGPGFRPYLQQGKLRGDKQAYPLDDPGSMPRPPSSWNSNFFPSKKIVSNVKVR